MHTCKYHDMSFETSVAWNAVWNTEYVLTNLQIISIKYSDNFAGIGAIYVLPSFSEATSITYT